MQETETKEQKALRLGVSWLAKTTSLGKKRELPQNVTAKEAGVVHVSLIRLFVYPSVRLFARLVGLRLRYAGPLHVLRTVGCALVVRDVNSFSILYRCEKGGGAKYKIKCGVGRRDDCAGRRRRSSRRGPRRPTSPPAPSSLRSNG